MILYSLNKKKAIIWDWNGTLLDDAEVCIYCMNELLRNRGFIELTKSRYREIFTFPVKEYYMQAGFDFSIEPFEIPAMQFIDLYYNNLKNANLFPEVKNVLQYFQEKAFNQSILSAMEHEKLMLSIEEKGIIDFFENITGIDDHYARSKVDIGRELVKRIPFSKEEIVLIGDTRHDFEVAELLDIDCILIANGHQSRERLISLNAIVINNLNELSDLI